MARRPTDNGVRAVRPAVVDQPVLVDEHPHALAEVHHLDLEGRTCLAVRTGRTAFRGGFSAEERAIHADATLPALVRTAPYRDAEGTEDASDAGLRLLAPAILVFEG